MIDDNGWGDVGREGRGLDLPSDRDLALYLLVRTDLPSMSWGKSLAQVHHAGVQMSASCAKSSLFLDYLADGERGGAILFNTTLALGATRNEIDIAFNRVILDKPTINAEFGKVIDPTYPFTVDTEIYHLLLKNHISTFVKHLDNNKTLFTREELTCAWFLGDRNDLTFVDIFKNLHLHP